MRLPRPMVAVALALLGCAAVAAPPRDLIVRGRVLDAEGAGVADVTVRLLQGRRELQVREWAFQDHVTASVVARTDEHGFFEAVVAPDPDYRYFWLRFYDAERFDLVRYRLPEDRDITARVRQGRPVTETVILEDHPSWAKVRAWIEQLGPGSDRGRLVRRLGIPDRRERSGGIESFWYEREAVVYRFRDGRFVGEEPIAAGEAP